MYPASLLQPPHQKYKYPTPLRDIEKKLVVTNGKSGKMEVGNEEVQRSTIHKINTLQGYIVGFPHSSVGKEFACSAGDLGSITGLGRSPGEGNGNPLQYPCLEISWTQEPGGLQSMG